MFITPKALSSEINAELLKNDRKACVKIGPAGVGKLAVYPNGLFFDRCFYIPISHIKRVFKRIAMSKGGFNKKGVFGSIPYIVIEYDDNKHKQFCIKREEYADEFLIAISRISTHIPLLSENAEKKLKEKKLRRDRINALLPISKNVRETINELEKARDFLIKNENLCYALSLSAKKKRKFDCTKKWYRPSALIIFVVGLVMFVLGGVGLLNGKGIDVPFYSCMLGLIFILSSLRVIPTLKVNKKSVREEYESYVEKMEKLIATYDNFPINAEYAHPIVIDWMIDALREGSAFNIEGALIATKKELMTYNCGVKVEMEDFLEIDAIKPLFLVANKD